MVALVPAAGRGLRLGAGVPKAFARLCGRTLLSHAVRGLLGSGCVDQVVVAVGVDDGALVEAALDDMSAQDAALGDVTQRVRLVTGGVERSDSVLAALEAVTDAEVVLVHDAARCLVPASVVRSVVEAVRAGHRAVVPALPVTDTVKQVGDGGVVIATVDRGMLRVAQTPQGFEPGLLRRAYAGVPAMDTAGGPVTDDAGLVERLGEPVMTVPGHPHAFKITTAFDLTVAEALAGDR